MVAARDLIINRHTKDQCAIKPHASWRIDILATRFHLLQRISRTYRSVGVADSLVRILEVNGLHFQSDEARWCCITASKIQKHGIFMLA